MPRSGVAPLDSVPSRFSGGRPDNDATYKPRLPLPLFKNAVHTRDFLSQFEDRMDVYRCSDVEKVAYLEESVRNSEADPWLRKYLLEHGRRCNFNLLVAEFVKAFTSPYDSEEARNAMENRIMRPSESVRAYLYDKLDLVVRCDPNMSELEQIRVIKRGLPREYQVKLVGFQFTTVKDLKAFLVNLEGEINTLTRLNILPSTGQADGPRVTINECKTLRPEREYFEEFAASLINAVRKIDISDRRNSRDSHRAPTPYRRDLSGTRSPQYEGRSRYRSGSREQIRDKSRGRYRDQSMDRDRRDRSRKQFRDQSKDRYRDQSRDRYSGQSRNRFGDQSSNRFRDQSRNRFRDHSNDRYRDQSRDSYRDQSGDRSGYQSKDRDDRAQYNERFREQSSDRRRSSFGKGGRDEANSKNGRA